MLQAENDSMNEQTPFKTAADEECALRDGMPVPRATRDRLAFLLWNLGARIDELADPRLEDAHVDARGYCILAILSVDGPDSQFELARLLGKAPGVIVAAVDQLEEKGFVERNRDPHDRRRSRVTLTTAGESALARADELADATVSEMLGGLDGAELVKLRQLLNKGLGFDGE
jgi:DNA-binding MarR family transcriptional regulator